MENRIYITEERNQFFSVSDYPHRHKNQDYCMCDCVLKEEERIQQEKEARSIEAARERCFCDGIFRSWRFENDRGIGDREAMQKARTYAEHLHEMYKMNVGLLIYGEVGRGKSYLAACIANKAVEMGFSCPMTDFSRIIDGAWDPPKEEGCSSKEKYFDSFSLPDFLVIDDFERERRTDYEVIERRCNSGKPIILTTNISPEDLTDEAQEISRKRIYSRLFDMTKPIEVTGHDLRRMQCVEKNAQAFEILGF